MQDLATIEKSLHGIAVAFQEGGLYFLIGVCAFLAYKVAVILVKRQRKATQEVTVNLPMPGTNGTNGHTPSLIREHEGRIAKAEGGLEGLAKSLETVRQENRQDHQQIFTAIENLKTA